MNTGAPYIDFVPACTIFQLEFGTVQTQTSLMQEVNSGSPEG
jgi:hypothetical protein